MKDSAKLKSNQILLTFKNPGDVEFIKAVCRRKDIDLESYILDNFEWDEMPECLSSSNDDSDEITKDTCDGCDYADRCPDVVKFQDVMI